MRPAYRDLDIASELKKNPDVQTGARLVLLDLLYDEKISISEFKAYCLENRVDYNNIEHCCGCAGCYEPKEGSTCPDFEVEDKPDCKIRDPVLCSICGKKGEIGYPLEDDKGKTVTTFWTCKVHSFNKEIEKALRRGTAVETIIRKWNT